MRRCVISHLSFNFSLSSFFSFFLSLLLSVFLCLFLCLMAKNLISLALFFPFSLSFFPHLFSFISYTLSYFFSFSVFLLIFYSLTYKLNIWTQWRKTMMKNEKKSLMSFCYLSLAFCISFVDRQKHKQKEWTGILFYRLSKKSRPILHS